MIFLYLIWCKSYLPNIKIIFAKYHPRSAKLEGFYFIFNSASGLEVLVCKCILTFVSILLFRITFFYFCFWPSHHCRESGRIVYLILISCRRCSNIKTIFIRLWLNNQHIIHILYSYIRTSLKLNYSPPPLSQDP